VPVGKFVLRVEETRGARVTRLRLRRHPHGDEIAPSSEPPPP
jgi:hypothetical protein